MATSGVFCFVKPTSSSRAASATVRAMGPTWSREGSWEAMPV